MLWKMQWFGNVATLTCVLVLPGAFLCLCIVFVCFSQHWPSHHTGTWNPQVLQLLLALRQLSSQHPYLEMHNLHLFSKTLLIKHGYHEGKTSDIFTSSQFVDTFYKFLKYHNKVDLAGLENVKCFSSYIVTINTNFYFVDAWAKVPQLVIHAVKVWDQ